jgi:hypothetical protein
LKKKEEEEAEQTAREKAQEKETKLTKKKTEDLAPLSDQLKEDEIIEEE